MSPKLASMWSDVRALLAPLAIYWLLLGGTFGAFAIAVSLDGPDPQGLMFLGFFGLVTFGGVGLGQLLAVLRVRDWVLFVAWGLIWGVGSAFGMVGLAALGAAAAPFMVLLVIAVFLGPIFMMAGAWSLRTGRDLFGTWVPLMYATGTTIVLAESSGRVSDWHQGSKWAVWDAVSLSVLAGTVTLLVAFLILRERRRLHLWRGAPGGLLAGSVKEARHGRPGLGVLGWAMVGMLALGLTAGSAIVGPYLWRTGRTGDHDGGGGGTGGTEQVEGKPQQGQGDGEGGSTSERVQREVEKNLKPLNSRDLQHQDQGQGQGGQQGVDLWSTLIILLLLTALAVVVFGRPIQRLLLVRHLRRPLWKVAPTAQVEHLWRLVEVALGDAGAAPRPGEAAVSLIERARPHLEKLPNGHLTIPGLEEAALVRDRVAFGLGVAATDPERMADVADDAYETVWNRLSDRAQLRALYRNLR